MSSLEETDFTLDLIKSITDNFSKEKRVGRGSYGEVYKGVLHGNEIAVKKLFPFYDLDNEAFDNEVKNLKSVNHKNVIRLISCCHQTVRKCIEHEGKFIFAEETDRVLCFEYMRQGCLAKHISEESCVHDWPTTYKIIEGTCEGLHYLHKGRGEKNYIYHLDLKPENILLDENMVPKIGDFGLSRLFCTSKTYRTSTMKGTPGFMPPEYINNYTMTPKNDVFSLGVIIFHMMVGRKGYDDYCGLRSSTDFSEKHRQEFIKSVQEYWKKKMQATTVHTWDGETAVTKCIEIAMRCVEVDRNQRPTTEQIMDDLSKLDARIEKLTGKDPKSLIGQALPSPTKSRQFGGSAGSAFGIEEKPWRLESLAISVNYSGLIYTFSFSYIDQAGKKHAVCPWGERYSEGETKKIIFGPSEFVVEVTGTYGSYYSGNDPSKKDLVMSLTFITNVKTYGPFGHPYHENVTANPFRFMADEDSSITGFYGRSGMYLFSIGVYMCRSDRTRNRVLCMPGQNLPTPTKSGPWGQTQTETGIWRVFQKAATLGTARDIKKMPWRLESLTISYCGCIDAFSFSYFDQAGKRQSVGPWGEGSHHDTTETEVSGSFSHGIHTLLISLAFVTNLRTYGPFGNPRYENVPGTLFEFRAPEGSSIVGFHGRSDVRINSFGVYTA